MTIELIIGKLSKANPLKKKLYIDSQILELNNILPKNNIPAFKTLSFKKRTSILSMCNKIYNDILPLLAKKLNQIHNCNYDKEFWEIIIGPWLNNFISISYNRFNKVKSVLNSYEISSVVFMKEKRKFIPISNYSLNKLSNDSSWNSLFYSNIIKYLKPSIIYNFKKIKIYEKNKEERKNFLKFFLSYFLSLFYKKHDPVIVSTYLPFYENLKLFLYLKQVPKIWSTPKLHRVKIDLKKRNLLKFPNTSKNKDLKNFIIDLIPQSIPICHVELFKKISNDLKKMKLPQKPKFIYTTNNYEFDEHFKLYVALKKINKTKYIIGQHGNISWLENIYFKKHYCADHYLSWGKNGFGKKINGFNFKIQRKKFTYNASGPLLILDSPYGTNNKIYNRIDENFKKENVLKAFLLNLDDEIKNKIIFKIHSSYRLRHKNYIKNIQKICPQIQIEKNNKKTLNLIKNSRCILHLYDSTGILETLSYNIPTVCIWQNKFNHIIKKYHKLYNELEKCNIFFNNPMNLSKHLNKNWKEINSWWLKKELQKQRKAILDNLSIVPEKNSVYKLSKKLIELSS